MANALFDKGREAFLTASASWSADTIKAALIHNSAGGTSYAPTLATDQFLSTVPAAAIIATSAALTSKTTTAGVANAASVTFSAVTGVQVDAILLYKDTGAGATSPLLAWIDTATGLPVVPNGGDIIVSWDTGANHIFKL